MAAAIYDMIIEQGETWIQNVYMKDGDDIPINITGYTARMQVKETLESVTSLVDLETGGSGITLDGTAGKITLRVESVVTESLPVGRFYYDLEIIDTTSAVTKLMRGRISVNKEVTI